MIGSLTTLFHKLCYHHNRAVQFYKVIHSNVVSHDLILGPVFMKEKLDTYFNLVINIKANESKSVLRAINKLPKTICNR